MQPSKSVSSASTRAPLASGWTSCAGDHQAPRQEHDGRDARRGGVGGQRRRRVAGRGARDRADAGAVGDHLLDDRDEHRHAEVLEGPGVRVAAHLHPEVVEAELLAVPFRPEQVRAALVHRDDVLVAEVRADPLLLAPDARPVRPGRALVAFLEQAHPARRDCAGGARPCRARPAAGRRRSGSGRSAARSSTRPGQPAEHGRRRDSVDSWLRDYAAPASVPMAASKSASDRPMRIGVSPLAGQHLDGLVAVARDADDDGLVARNGAALDELARGGHRDARRPVR